MKIQIAVGLILLLFFAFFIPASVTLEDSGELLMVASSFGLAHAPGYPLFGMIGGLFGLLPTGNLAWNLHLMSAIFGALTLVFAYKVALIWTNSRAASVFGVALAAFTPALAWFFTVAEVYSQLTFIFFVCLYVLLKDPKSPWFYFLVGLGLCTHWPLFVFAAPAFLLVRQALIKELRPKAIVFLLVGLIPMIFLWVRGGGDGFLTMGKINDLSDLWNLVAINNASGLYLDPSLRDHWLLFADACHKLGRDFNVAGVVAALAGLGLLLKQKQYARFAALVWLILGSNIILQQVIRLKYNTLYAEQVEQFCVLPVLAMGLAAAIGAARIARYKWAVPGMALVIAAGFGLNWNKYEWPAQSRFASEIARTYLASFPPNAVVLLHGDSDLGPLGYVHHIEGVRPDLKLYAQNGFLLRPPGVDDLVDYSEKVFAAVRDQVIAGGRVVSIRLRPEMRAKLTATGLQIYDYGLFSEVALPGRPAEMNFDLQASVISLADRYVSGELRPRRWRYYRDALVSPLCRYFLQQKIDHPLLKTTVYCRYYSLKDNPAADPSQIEAVLADAKYFPEDERATISEGLSRR